MAAAALVTAASFQTGAVLTLALPLGVLILVVIWYAVLWARGMGER